MFMQASSEEFTVGICSFVTFPMSSYPDIYTRIVAFREFIDNNL